MVSTSVELFGGQIHVYISRHVCSYFHHEINGRQIKLNLYLVKRLFLHKYEQYRCSPPKIIIFSLSEVKIFHHFTTWTYSCISSSLHFTWIDSFPETNLHKQTDEQVCSQEINEIHTYYRQITLHSQWNILDWSAEWAYLWALPVIYHSVEKI